MRRVPLVHNLPLSTRLTCTRTFTAMLTAQAGFATTFTTLFTPLGDEHSLTSRHPGAEHTLRNIDQYQDLMAELRDAVQPELELIDSRITAPLKEYQELLKKIRKTITKREHKVRYVLFSFVPSSSFPRLRHLAFIHFAQSDDSLPSQLVDFDRHNNSYSKLKEKKEKSLSDEKNLFKYEQDLEVATQEYEHYNRFVLLALSFHLTSELSGAAWVSESGEVADERSLRQHASIRNSPLPRPLDDLHHPSLPELLLHPDRHPLCADFLRCVLHSALQGGSAGRNKKIRVLTPTCPQTPFSRRCSPSRPTPTVLTLAMSRVSSRSVRLTLSSPHPFLPNSILT